MLHDPRWDIGSKAHIIAWLERKPADETFQFFDAEHCACGQYSEEFLGHGSEWLKSRIHPFSLIKNIHHMNVIASDIVYRQGVVYRSRPPVSWGELLAAVKEAWVDEVMSG